MEREQENRGRLSTSVAAGDVSNGSHTSRRSTGPAWWVQDIVIATVLGLLLFAGQLYFDDRRADREQEVAEDLALEAERLENLRFVRERSGSRDQLRPFFGLDFTFLELSGLILTESDMRGAFLFRSNVAASDLSSSDLSGVQVFESTIASSDFRQTTFGCLDRAIAEARRGLITECARIEDTMIIAVDLTDADLRGASILDTYIGGGTTLEGADLRETDLGGVTLDGVDLRRALLDETTNIHGACFDASTRWPAGFDVPRPSESACDTLYSID